MRHEDELLAWAIGSVAKVQDIEAVRGKILLDLLALAEAQRRHRPQGLAVNDRLGLKCDEGERDLCHSHGRDRSRRTRDGDGRWGDAPRLPVADLRSPGLEHKPAARPKARTHSAQREMPVIVGDEHLSDVARHHRQIGAQPQALQSGRVSRDPFDPLGVRLSASHIERRSRRVEAHDMQAECRQPNGQRPGPAADVDHGAGREFLGDRHVHVKVRTIVLEEVVQDGLPGIGEDGVGLTHRPRP